MSRTYRDQVTDQTIKADLGFKEKQLEDAKKVLADRPSDILFLRADLDATARLYEDNVNSEKPIGAFQGAQLVGGWEAIRKRSQIAASAYRELLAEANAVKS